MSIASLFRRGGRLAGDSTLGFTLGADAFFFTPDMVGIGGYPHATYWEEIDRFVGRGPVGDEDAFILDGQAIRAAWEDVGDCLRWAIDEFDPVEEFSVQRS